MTTAGDIVNAAWRRITESASDESVPAADSADLLEMLNDYLYGLETSCAYTHYTLALAGTLQTPPSLDGALKDVLRVKGAEGFGLSVPATAMRDGDRGEAKILSVMMTPTDLTVESGIFNTLHSNRYDIDSG